VAKKRETMKSKLNEVELKLHELREQLDDKKQAFDGQEILKGDAVGIFARARSWCRMFQFVSLSLFSLQTFYLLL